MNTILKILWINLFLFGCGPEYRRSQFNIATDIDTVTLNQLDEGVSVLADEFVKANLVQDRKTVEDIVRAGVFFVQKSDVPFYCGPVLAVGCTAWNYITLYFKKENGGCIGRTPYLHELTHNIMCGLGNCDPDHEQKNWWVIPDSIAFVIYEKEICRN